MSMEITANELKVKGISAIDDVLAESEEAVITVRGKQKYVVLPFAHYNQLREYELEAAILEARRDFEQGTFIAGSVEDHMSRILDV